MTKATLMSPSVQAPILSSTPLSLRHPHDCVPGLGIQASMCTAIGHHMPHGDSTDIMVFQAISQSSLGGVLSP